MEFIASLSKMSMVMVAFAAGYVANKLHIMGGETDHKITKLILTITLPAMALGAVATSEELPDAAELLGLLEVTVAFYGISFLLAAVLPRFLGGSGEQKSVWRFAISFSNVGFIGIPVATAFFGDAATLYAVILMLPFNLLSYALGPLMLTGGFRDFSWKKLCNPAVISSLLALVMTLLRIHPPMVVGECLEFVGDMTPPLSLLVIGSSLAGVSFGRVFASPRLWALTVIRLLVLPLVLYVALTALGIGGLALGVSVLQIAMPVAANGTMLAMEYGGDSKSMAQATFLTTLCSMVTVPVLATFLLG